MVDWKRPPTIKDLYLKKDYDALRAKIAGGQRHHAKY